LAQFGKLEVLLYEDLHGCIHKKETSIARQDIWLSDGEEIISLTHSPQAPGFMAGGEVCWLAADLTLKRSKLGPAV